MSKMLGVNSSYFVSIHAAQNYVPEGDGALILHVLTPAGVVLRSGTVAVCNLHLPYRDRYIYQLFIYNSFLLSSSICFFL